MNFLLYYTHHYVSQTQKTPSYLARCFLCFRVTRYILFRSYPFFVVFPTVLQL
jgi:hypothetical protein